MKRCPGISPSLQTPIQTLRYIRSGRTCACGIELTCEARFEVKSVLASKDLSAIYPQVLRDVIGALTTHPQLSELLPTVLEQMRPMLETSEFAVVLLWDPGEGVFNVQAAHGEAFRNPEALKTLALHPNEGVTGKVYDQGRPILLSSPTEVDDWMGDMSAENWAAIAASLGGDIQPHQVAAIPLEIGLHKFGVLLFGSLESSSFFTQEDLPLLSSLADLISVAMDRARLEEEVSSVKEAGLSGRLQAEAFATLSHELRTPLAAIKGYSTAMLVDEVEWPDEKRQEFLKLIDGECDDLEVMINDILDAALIDIDQLTLEPQPVRLERLAQETAEEMRGRAEDHHLVVDFPNDLPILDIDPRRIKQVIRNILDNAVKYSPEGGLIVVRGELRAQDIVVSISDQGIGISPEDLIPLFDRYFRVKSPTGYHVAGTGLGLPVARAIVEAHGGRIWAQSQMGEGTTLSFSLPLTDSTDTDPAEPTSAKTIPGPEAG